MAGHSHFANIKHKKGAADAKKSKIFTKIQREIISAIKTANGEPSEEFNPRLRLAIIKAKGMNMPKEKIDAAIKKATGANDGENFEAMRYDCYGPAGVGIIVEALTDNKNRTAGEIRSLATKCGGNMGETGSLDFIFTIKTALILTLFLKKQRNLVQMMLKKLKITLKLQLSLKIFTNYKAKFQKFLAILLMPTFNIALFRKTKFLKVRLNLYKNLLMRLKTLTMCKMFGREFNFSVYFILCQH